MKIQVVYISAEAQCLVDIDADNNICVNDAIALSGVLNQFPDISLEQNKVGVFGEIVELDYRLKEGDRVEIYRALSMDPMEARRLRAKTK
jgi:putative ubiquitin-RnfH superfamily antitoxin RatB of RatAB toxin-antitoxin module